MILKNVPALRVELFRIALRILRRVDLAEDATQTALMKVWYANLADEKVKPAAITAVKNAAIDTLRSIKARKIELDGEMALESAVQRNECEADPRFEILWDLELSNKQWDIISLMLSGHSQERISEIMNVPSGTIRSEVTRIRAVALAETDETEE